MFIINLYYILVYTFYNFSISLCYSTLYSLNTSIRALNFT